MFGQDLAQQAGGQAPQAPQQQDPVAMIMDKLDQILALLMQDKQSDMTEGENGATQSPLG